MNRAFENFSAIDGRLAVFVAPLCAFGAYGSPGAAIGFADTPRLNRLKHRLCSTTVDMANRWHPFPGARCVVCGGKVSVYAESIASA